MKQTESKVLKKAKEIFSDLEDYFELDYSSIKIWNSETDPDLFDTESIPLWTVSVRTPSSEYEGQMLPLFLNLKDAGLEIYCLQDTANFNIISVPTKSKKTGKYLIPGLVLNKK